MNLTPLNSNIHVRFLKEAEQTSGGIYLPDICRDNFQSGEVLATGAGYPLPESVLRTAMYTAPGDVVLFYPHDLRLLAGGAEAAIITEENLIAMASDAEEGELIPLNDWVMIEPAAREERTIGGIIIPDEFRQRANFGTILDYGPGYLRLSGPYYGSRKSVPGIMGLSPHQVIGSTVYWSDAAESLVAGQESAAATFVRAGDLLILSIGGPDGEA